MPHQLLYVSNTSRSVSQAELSQILAVSRSNNAGLGVTGMLLYLDGGFLQVLEGEPRIVEELYEKIARDKRHWNAAKLLDRDAPPAFAQWSMGFKHVSQDDGSAFELTRDAIGSHRLPTDLMAMLRTFYAVQES